MKKLFLVILVLLGSVVGANAQSQRNPCFYTTANPGPGNGCIPVSGANPLPVTASVSVGGFTPNLNFATLTATGSSASVALPTGATVFFQNNGTTTVSCTLGTGSATATTNEILVPASSGVPIVVGTSTWGACIDQSGSASNLVVLAGGAGLGTPFGGGSSGGGGLSVLDNSSWTNNTSNFTPNGGVFNDSATALTTGNQGTVRLNANREMHVTCDTGNVLCQWFNTINTTAGLPLASQSPAVPIGGVGICDGANGATNPCTTAATVKAASTPAAATDKAIVVDQRPGGTTAASVAAVKSSVPIINGANTYNTVAASQTTQALTGGSGGATGDYLSHCVILPTTTAAGTVIIYDNATAIFTFTTGTLSNLVPFAIPVGAVSTSGAWKVTTGANETVTCVGKFT